MGEKVYLEVGTRRTFACALDWPGWCRAGRGEDGALQALVDAAARYRRSVGSPARGLGAVADPSELEVVERLAGNATTDFGAPAIEASSDERPLADDETKRLVGLLRACWRAFDRAADAGVGRQLRKGPRGGGRDLEAIVVHVLDADGAYLRSLGGRSAPKDGDDVASRMAALRRAMVETLRDRARGTPLPESGRRRAAPWLPRYAVRRSAWHAIDHAWEIEDRSRP